MRYDKVNSINANDIVNIMLCRLLGVLGSAGVYLDTDQKIHISYRTNWNGHCDTLPSLQTSTDWGWPAKPIYKIPSFLVAYHIYQHVNFWRDRCILCVPYLTHCIVIRIVSLKDASLHLPTIEGVKNGAHVVTWTTPTLNPTYSGDTGFHKYLCMTKCFLIDIHVLLCRYVIEEYANVWKTENWEKQFG